MALTVLTALSPPHSIVEILGYWLYAESRILLQISYILMTNIEARYLKTCASEYHAWKELI